MSTKPIEYCDIVMKGGITSGIVYPNAVLALAERYTFKNIGGTSAGAIAAAALAAAALGERRRELAPAEVHGEDSKLGFRGLAEVAGRLKTPGFILGLFQPTRGARRLFDLVLAFTRRPGPLGSGIAAARLVGATAPVTTLLTAFLLLAPIWLSGGPTAFLLALVPSAAFALALGAFVTLRFLAGEIRANELGICPGRKVPVNGSGGEGLTDWLHRVLQEMSGQQERPLLFQDLWDAPRHEDEPGNRGIGVEMITTGISHHEPRRLPFENSRFWFRRDQFARLFPDEVVDWMATLDPSPLTIDGETYYRLPEYGQLPLIVATRMSLSFPLLLSAVPLYEGTWKSGATSQALDVELGANSLSRSSDALAVGGRRSSRQPEQVRICWFSDGGIGSNFPIHLFDAPLPRWPTFAIDLVYPGTTDVAPRSDVFLPTGNNQGWQRRWSSIAAPGATKEIGSFLFAIIGTMQNWRDILQARAPGHRDRIVSIALAADEGGMNLDMPGATLERIASKGTKAGELLYEKFDFNNHWWVRWRNAASAVERFTVGFATAASAAPSDSYRDAHSSARTGRPQPPSYPFTVAQQEEASHRFDRMTEDGKLWEDTVADLTDGTPKPLPQLRITPTY